MAEQNYTINIIVNGKDNGATATLGGVQGALGNVAQIAGGNIIGGAITGAIGGIADLGANILQTGFSFNSLKQQASNAFGVMLGDAGKAQGLLDDLQGFAASTPFEFPQLLDASKKLLAFNVDAKDMIPTLTRLGDVSAGVGVPVNELADLYGKAKVQGRLFSQDINQLTGRGIPIIGELAKQFGVSEGEVMKLVETGKVGFPQLEQAFKDLTGEGGKFNGLMAVQSKSFGGLMSTLQDTAVQAAGTITAPLFEIASEGLGSIVDFVSGGTVQGALTSLGAGIADFLRGTLIPSIQAFVPVLLTVFSTLAPMFGNVVSFLSGVIVPAIQQVAAFAMPLLMSAFSQFVAFGQGTLLPALMAVGAWFSTTFLPALQTVGSYIGQNLLPILGNIATFVVSTILPAFLSFAGFLITTVAPIVLQFAGGVLNLLGGALAGIGGFINENIVPALVVFGQWLSANLPKAIQVGVSFFNTVLLPAFSQVGAFIGGTVVPILSKVGEIIGIVLVGAVRALGGGFSILGGFINETVKFVTGNLIPTLSNLVGVITTTIQPVIETFAGIVQGLANGFEGVWHFGAFVIDILGQIADAIANIDLTPILPLIGQSPAPLAIGLASINEELKTNLPLMRELAGATNGITFGTNGALTNAGAAMPMQPYWAGNRQTTINVDIRGDLVVDSRDRVDELVEQILARLRHAEYNEAGAEA